MRRFIIFVSFLTILAISAQPGFAGEIPKGYDIDASEDLIVSNEFGYPTPYVLTNLGLKGFLSKTHKEAFAIEDGRKLIFPKSGDPLEKAAKSVLDLKINPEQKLTVLSLGEGWSGLVPYLRTVGLDAKGSDICYGDDKVGKQDAVGQAYWKKYKEHLFYADATNLKDIKKDSFDLVLSHMVFPYIPNGRKTDFIAESFRVTKRGGSVRIGTVLFRHLLEGEDKDKALIDGAKKLLDGAKLDASAYDLILLHGTVDLKAKEDYFKATPRYPSDAFSWEEFSSLFMIKKTEDLLERIKDNFDSFSKLQILTIILVKK